MLWGQNKKTRETLDALLLRIDRMEHSIESLRDNIRKVHIDIHDSQKMANEKLDGIISVQSLKEEIIKKDPIKRSKRRANNITHCPL